MKLHKTFRLEQELIQKLEEQAKNQNRTLANLIETILKDYIYGI